MMVGIREVNQELFRTSPRVDEHPASDAAGAGEGAGHRASHLLTLRSNPNRPILRRWGGKDSVETTLSSLFGAADQGDASAADALFGALYAELHRLAKRQLARHGAGMSLGATTLLHQAYINMSAGDDPALPDRARFMGYAARVMRRLIIDHARNRHAQKRGGRFEITALPTDAAENAIDDRELTRISSALDELVKMEPALAEIVDLKFFCGFSFAEIAAMHNVSERTVQRKWREARIYLHRSVRTSLSL